MDIVWVKVLKFSSITGHSSPAVYNRPCEQKGRNQSYGGRGAGGKWVAPGAYAYTIRFTRLDGMEYHQHGMLQLIR